MAAVIKSPHMHCNVNKGALPGRGGRGSAVGRGSKVPPDSGWARNGYWRAEGCERAADQTESTQTKPQMKCQGIHTPRRRWFCLLWQRVHRAVHSQRWGCHVVQFHPALGAKSDCLHAGQEAALMQNSWHLFSVSPVFCRSHLTKWFSFRPLQGA